MPHSATLVPEEDTRRDIYLVLDDFGSLGRVWRETDEAGTNRTWMIRNLLEGQYENPVRIVAFNMAEGWCRDVTLDIADAASTLHWVRRSASLSSQVLGDRHPALSEP